MTRNKRRNSAQTLPAPNPEIASHDWKSSPVIVAGGSVAATVLLCIAVVTQVVVPTQTAKLEIEALKAKDALRTTQLLLTSSQKQNKELTSKNSALTLQVTELGEQLFEARSGSIFGPGNPYPAGLGIVRIGLPIDEVRKRFLPSQIETDQDRPEVLKVNLQNSPFIWATYSFDKRDPQKRIAQVAFTLDYRRDFANRFLSNKISEAIGTPMQEPQRDYYRWPDTAGLSIYLLGDTYMIMAPTYSPSVWPD